MQRLSPFGICLLLCLAALAVAVYFYCADPERFPVRTIRITASLNNLPAEEIQNLLENQINANYFFCRPKQMERVLRQHRWVKQANVLRVWPDSLKIMIIEKLPIAWWNEKLITAQAEVIQPLSAAKYSLPHLTGPDNQKGDVLQIYQNVSKILSDYGLSIDSLILRNNQALDLVLTNGIQLNLGKQAIETRITRFCRAYSTVFAEKKAQLARVDLRYPRGMAVQWSK